MKPRPQVVLLDRDGVINEDSDDYIKSADEWHPLPGSLEAIARLHQAGIQIGVVTNQSGVGRGLYSLETLGDIHRHMLEQVHAAGGEIQRIFVCPHAPDDGCDCRKPKPGLLFQALEYFACGLDNMVLVGDKYSDIQSAKTAGVRPILVKTGKGMKTLESTGERQDFTIYDDLRCFVSATLD